MFPFHSLTGVAEEQHELTADEERDVEAVLSSYGGMSNDTSFLTARLQEELDLLETANVHAILESEADVGENGLQMAHTATSLLPVSKSTS